MKQKIWQSMSRRRDDHIDESNNKMARVMGIFDLTALGVGATLGLGIYVLAAEVAKNHAGPAVCISFLIAAIASGLSGICYAEFASRVPKSGSAYIYSYVTVGELIAFIIGWNLVFEYIIGTASVAKGLSKYIDSLSNNSIHEFQKSIISFDYKNFAKYPDFFALIIVIILTIFLCIGVKESNYLNIIFGTINITTIIIVIIAGAFNADLKNWQISPNNVTEINVNVGTGGFIPFEISGIISGAAQSFFGFIGFDAIASCSEESKNPKKNVPRAIIISLLIIFISYISIAIVLTLMWPYYLQNPDSAFPHVFKQVKMPVIGIIVNIGGLVAMIPSLIGALFPASRILYAMANDGLIFKCFTNININTKTPMFSTIITGIMTGIMTIIFDLEQLVSMASIGSLLAYSIVAISVLFLRYQNDNDNKKIIISNDDTKNNKYKTSTHDYLMQFFNLRKQKYPTDVSCKIASWTIFLFTIFSFIFAILRNIIFSYENDNYYYKFIGYIVLSIIGFLLLFLIIIIGRQPTGKVDVIFKVPCVPLIPCLSIFINTLLMVYLNKITWIRFVIWMTLGIVIYILYGMKNSLQGKRDMQKIHHKLSFFFLINNLDILVFNSSLSI